MCGIFGVVASAPRFLPGDPALVAATHDLAHRGPDAEAHTHLERAAFAHTRLALLDLRERANQPMWDETGRHCLLYNGEIYNFRELRSELERAGRRFRTESDTEVLLEGLLQEGERFLPRLEGMFAFALYDSREHRLLLGRDRFGIKPLVYSDGGDTFRFASEVRPLRHAMELHPEPGAVAAYLAGEDPATEGQTLFAGVRSLACGHWLKRDAQGRISTGAFATPAGFADRELAAELAEASPRAIARRLDELFQRSVEKHLIADVEVGCLASGGLDSSLITAMAVRHKPDLVLFHADVVGRKSERDAAERLARLFGLELHTVPVDDATFLSLVPETVLRYEAPFTYHPNSVPFLAVAKLVERHRVKAILSGEGSDEAFLGYASARRRAVRERLGRAGGEEREAVPAGHPSMSGRERRSDRRSIDAQKAAGVPVVDRQSLELLSYHLRTLMHRNDRLGMGASIEARFPFLDHALVALAANLGPRLKVRPGLRRLIRNRHAMVVKWPVRKVAESYLPPDLAYRRKRGFPTTGLRRLEIDNEYFAGSPVAEETGSPAAEWTREVEEAGPARRVRLLMADLWLRLSIAGEELEDVRARVEAHARIAPE